MPSAISRQRERSEQYSNAKRQRKEVVFMLQDIADALKAVAAAAVAALADIVSRF